MRMNTAAAKGLLTIALCALGGAAQAHVGHEGGHAATFVSGLAHPVSGLDHLLAMVAVGLWSAVACRGAVGRRPPCSWSSWPWGLCWRTWVLRCPWAGRWK
jgi:hydrogenase/urease accessory protein HupE